MSARALALVATFSLALAAAAGAAERYKSTVEIPPAEIPWWIDQADWELTTAERAMTIEGYAAAVVLAHQAVEKYLKVLHVLDGLGAPSKTHDLDRLARALGLPPALVRDADRLDRDYIRCRYPDAARGVPHEVCDRRLAEDRLSRARRIVAYLREQVARLRAPRPRSARRSGRGLLESRVDSRPAGRRAERARCGPTRSPTT